MNAPAPFTHEPGGERLETQTGLGMHTDNGKNAYYEIRKVYPRDTLEHGGSSERRGALAMDSESAWLKSDINVYHNGVREERVL